jgi:hypothetical protein
LRAAQSYGATTSLSPKLGEHSFRQKTFVWRHRSAINLSCGYQRFEKTHIYHLFRDRAFFGILYWYQYYHPHRDRSISISDADISRIYDSKSARSKLRVLDAHGVPVEGDVYLIKLAAWNSGSEPIESGDVRIPLTVGIKNCTRILDKNFFKEKNPKVSRYTLSETRGGDGEAFPFGVNGIAVTWSHLDPGEGLELQAIVEAQDLPEVIVRGHFAGIWAREFHSRGPKSSATAKILVMGSAVITAFVGLVSQLAGRTKWGQQHFGWVLLIVFGGVAAMMWVLLMILHLGSTPPF